MKWFILTESWPDCTTGIQTSGNRGRDGHCWPSRIDPYVQNYRIRLLPWIMTIELAGGGSTASRTSNCLCDLSNGLCVPTVCRSPWSVSFPLRTPQLLVVTSLFARFSGTTRLSDFPETYMSALWHLAFSGRSTSEHVDVSGISPFPRGMFPTVRVVPDSV